MSSCVDLVVLSDKTKDYYEGWWLAIGFIVGLIIGLVIAFLLLRLCIAGCLKKRRQDEEESLRYSKLQEKDEEKAMKSKFGMGSVKKSIRKTLKLRLKKAKKNKEQYEDSRQAESSVGEPTVLIALEMDDLEAVEPGDGTGSLVDAMVQATEEGGDNELLKLDVKTVLQLEQGTRLQRIIALAELLRLYLNKLAQADRITEIGYEDLVNRIHEGAKNLRAKLEAEVTDLREELENDENLKKNPALLQQRLEELPSKQNSILNTLLVTEQMEMVGRLSREGKLSEDEADAMLLALASDMAAYERALSEQQAQQRARLNDRLARRQQLIAANKKGAEDDHDDLEAQLAVKELEMDILQKQKGIPDKVRDEIVNRYREDIIRLHNAHEENVQQQQRKLQERLQQQRQQRLKDLSAKQLLKQREFLRRVDQVTETGDFVLAYNALINQQAIDREAVIKELDEYEEKEVANVREDLSRERAMHLNELEDKFMDTVRSQASLAPYEMDNLVMMHQRQVQDWKRMKMQEKQMNKMKLEQRIAERKYKREEEDQQSQAEEKTLRDHQVNTLKKTLTLQVEVSDETKDRIMKEHEQNVEALSNQLALSRNRQHRQTEQRMAERRAQLAALKKQKADAQLARGPKAAPAVDKEFDERIQKAERETAASKAKELEEMRDRLSRETAEALEAQEKQLSGLMARMQLGQARRQNIIAKQDNTIAQLEEQLQRKLESSGQVAGGDGGLHLEQLLQEHQNQVQNLAESLADNKSQQQAMLEERLRRKRQKKQYALTTKMNEEAGEEKDRLQMVGISRTGTMIMETALEKRHKGAMEQLEAEMMVELQREQEEMNRELEQQLQKELAEQQKNFLAALASVADLNEEEVKQVAESAAKNSGVEGKQARRFVRDFRQSFRRSHSTLQDDAEPPRSRRVVRFPDEVGDTDDYGRHF